MSIRTWLGRVGSGSASGVRLGRTARRARSRPTIEALERRLALSNEPISPVYGPDVMYNGTSNMSNAPIYLMFWGQQWNLPGGMPGPTAGAITNATNALLSSPYFSELAQYGSVQPERDLAGSVVDTRTALPSGGGFDDNTIVSVLENAFKSQPNWEVTPPDDVNNGTGPYPLYVVIAPPGTSFSPSPGATGGYGNEIHYHGFLNLNRTPTEFAWVADDGNLDDLTRSLSQVMADALTAGNMGGPGFKPPASAPGANGQIQEVADGEATDYTARINGVLVSSYWSNAQHGFVLPDGGGFAPTPQLYYHGGELDVSGSSISMDTTTNGGFLVTADGETGYYAPGKVTSIRVATGSGNSNVVTVAGTPKGDPLTITPGGPDYIDIGGGPASGHSSLLGGPITLAKGAGSPTVTLNDSNGGAGAEVQLAADAVTGLTPGSVSWAPGSLAALNVLGPGNVEFVVNTPDVPTLYLLGGAGEDAVNVNALSSQLLVNGSANSNLYVALGDATAGAQGGLTGISGNVTVLNLGGGSIAVDMDDYGDTRPRQVSVTTKAVYPNGLMDSLTGLEPGVIEWQDSRTEHVSLQGGSGGNTFTIASVDPAVMELDAGAGNDTVNVSLTAGPLMIDGVAGSDRVTLGDPAHYGMSSLGGPVSVSNDVGKTALVLQDGGDTIGSSATLTTDPQVSGPTDPWAEMTGLGGPRPQAVAWDATEVGSLQIVGGPGGNAWDILTTGSPSTTLDAGSGGDTVDVGWDPPSQVTAGPVTRGGTTLNLTGAPAATPSLTVVGSGAGNTSLLVDDRASSLGQSYTLSGGTVTKAMASAPGTVVDRLTYSGVATLALDVGTGGNAVTASSPAATITRLNGLATKDKVTVGSHAGPVYLGSQALPGAATALRVSGPAGHVTAGGSFTVSVTAVDAAGNVATGFTGKAHFTVSDGDKTLPADYTFKASDAGMHTFTLDLTKAGSPTLTVASSGPSLAASMPVTVVPGAAAGLVLAAPSTATVGAPLSLTATVVDAFGNVVTGDADTLTLAAAGAAVKLPAAVTLTAANQGRYTFVVTPAAAGKVTFTIVLAGRKVSATAQVDVKKPT